jgi:hypothetical protein
VAALTDRRAATDVNRLAEAGSSVRTAPLVAAVAALTPRPETHRRATPADHRSTPTPRGGERARMSAIVRATARPVVDALMFGALVGLLAAIAAYGLARGRLRLLDARNARPRTGSSWAAFGTTLASRPEAVRSFAAAHGADVRRPREPSRADRSTRPPAARLEAVPLVPASTATAPEAGPSQHHRHGPWQPDEITAGLLIGCRIAGERNAVLTQRLLRTLAQEDARVPSWSVVDRAARKAGQTGGAWLREARHRHEHGPLQAVPTAYRAEARAAG